MKNIKIEICIKYSSRNPNSINSITTIQEPKREIYNMLLMSCNTGLFLKTGEF